MPNNLMRKYSKFPFLLLVIWLIRGTIFVLLLSLFVNPQIIRNISIPIGNE